MQKQTSAEATLIYNIACIIADKTKVLSTDVWKNIAHIFGVQVKKIEMFK